MENNCSNVTNIRAIDLFCGAGGSSWGARQAGVEVAACFDLWDLAGRNHHNNFPDTKFYLGRLEEQNIDQIATEVGKIDLILASPECTNHSPAKGNKPRCENSKNTAFQVTRFANKFRPRWIVVENVVSMRKWARYREFKQTLVDLGYHLQEQVLNSADFAVAQSRRRLFLLCDLAKQPSLTPTTSPPPIAAECIVDFNGTYQWTPLKTQNRATATLERAERGIKELGADVPFLLVYYGSDHAGGWQDLSRPLRTITTVDRFALVKPTPDGHVMRMLQVPELQKAMGMDGMRFEYGTRRERIKMIGNAVCPPVMKKVIESLTAGAKR